MANQEDPWTLQLVLAAIGLGLLGLLGLASLYHRYVQPFQFDSTQIEQSS